MELDEAIAWLEDHIDFASWTARSSRARGVDLSLDRMERLLARLGDPHRRLQMVHVTGTNGKGSTSRLATRLLMAHGLRVGTYSSPHLAAYNERFRVDDADIDGDTLAALLTEVRDVEDAGGERLLPFEILTAVGYLHFARAGVDAAVIEVGVLGRYDATNVADGRVAVITNIGFDHTTGEGDWQLRIAEEKAGIVKPGSHVVIGDLDARFDGVIAAQQPAAVWRLGRDVVVLDDDPSPTGRRFSVRTPWQTLEAVDVPLHGAHQTTNAALAITAASAFVGSPLDDAAVRAGLAAVRMPARLERVALPNGAIAVLDGAHNPDAARALSASLAPLAGRRTLVVGVLEGRDPAAMLTALCTGVQYDRIITTTPPTARARPARELATAALALGLIAAPIDDIATALHSAIAECAPGDEVVVTGSIYLVAEARALLL